MKRIVFISVSIILLLVIFNLSYSLVTLWSKKDVLATARLQLQKEQQEHEKLQEQLQQVNDPSFIEQQARDKLFMGKSGESIVLFPTASPSAQVREIAPQKAIWQQWFELFFH